MNPLKRFETTLASLLEGAFGRLFRSEVRPMELARKLAREMDEHRTASVSRVYAPNEYAVWLSPQDRARYDGVEHDLIDELCAYLLEHARGENLTLVSPPLITFHTDEDLTLGEFGIQARIVRPDGHEGEGDREESVEWVQPERKEWASVSGFPPGAAPPAHREDQHGQTMIYSTSRRLREPLEQQHSASTPPRALLVVAGRRLLVATNGAVIGRSRDCDIVFDDAGISRRHAHIRPTTSGSWTIEDLHSTNGVLLNGERLHGVHPLHVGDRIELGSTEIVFELR
jgi:Protein of unknown function (DUF3662)/FHA domain